MEELRIKVNITQAIVSQREFINKWDRYRYAVHSKRRSQGIIIGEPQKKRLMEPIAPSHAIYHTSRTVPCVAGAMGLIP